MSRVNGETPGVVYLLHFEGAYRHARHYLGWSTEDGLTARVERHVSGKGTPLVRAAVEAGCEVRVARVWRGRTRRDEARMKAGHDRKALCPICGPERRARKAAALRRLRARRRAEREARRGGT